MKKITAILIVALLFSLSGFGCAKNQTIADESSVTDLPYSAETVPRNPTTSEAAGHNSEIRPEDVRLIQFDDPEPGDSIATITTSEGEIKVRMFKKQAPQTVEVFERLVNDGYYNGQQFDTIVAGYKIEGGGKHGDAGFPESGEFSLELWNFRGAVSLANNGTDFMIIGANICLNPITELEELNFPEAVIEKYAEIGGAPHQDWENTVFGHVTEGMDVVDKIASAKTNEEGRPENPVIIASVKVATI